MPPASSQQRNTRQALIDVHRLQEDTCDLPQEELVLHKTDGYIGMYSVVETNLFLGLKEV